MDISLDPARISYAADTLEARAADLASRRASIEATVESLLADWHGAAATRFAGLWREWRDSASAVNDGLSASVVAVRYARDELVSADAGVGDSHDRLRGRLG